MSLLVTQIEEGIVQLNLNRPEKRNALNVELLKALCVEIKKASNQRALIICGADPVFCSGMDVKEKAPELIAELYRTIHDSPVLTLAAVQGAALAGGLGLMAACDLVIAHPNTLFGLPELQIGLVPALVMVVLSRRILQCELREMIFLGEKIDAAKAKSLGLINRISDQPQKLALELARQSLKGVPEAMKSAKQLLNGLDPGFSQQLEIALRVHH